MSFSSDNDLTLTDEDLVARVRAGDREAYGVLWQRHSAAALSVARQYQSVADPEDILQEAAKTVFSSILRGGGPFGAFRPYLKQSVRNTAVSISRRRRESPIGGLDEIAEHSPNISYDDNENALDRMITVRAFKALPARWQEVLWYTSVEGMPAREAATRLGLSANATAALAKRAREGLRRSWLEAHVNDDRLSPTCRAIVHQLPAYERGALSAEARNEVDTHLEDCLRCSIIAGELDTIANRLPVILLPLALAGIDVFGTGSALAKAVLGTRLIAGAVGSSAQAAGAVGQAAAAASSSIQSATAAAVAGRGADAAAAGVAAQSAAGASQAAGAGTGAAGPGAGGAGGAGASSVGAGAAGAGASGVGGVAATVGAHAAVGTAKVALISALVVGGIAGAAVGVKMIVDHDQSNDQPIVAASTTTDADPSPDGSATGDDVGDTATTDPSISTESPATGATDGQTAGGVEGSGVVAGTTGSGTQPTTRADNTQKPAPKASQKPKPSTPSATTGPTTPTEPTKPTPPPPEPTVPVAPTVLDRPVDGTTLYTGGAVSGAGTAGAELSLVSLDAQGKAGQVLATTTVDAGGKWGVTLPATADATTYGVYQTVGGVQSTVTPVGTFTFATPTARALLVDWVTAIEVSGAPGQTVRVFSGSDTSGRVVYQFTLGKSGVGYVWWIGTSRSLTLTFAYYDPATTQLGVPVTQTFGALTPVAG